MNVFTFSTINIHLKRIFLNANDPNTKIKWVFKFTLLTNLLIGALERKKREIVLLCSRYTSGCDNRAMINQLPT